MNNLDIYFFFIFLRNVFITKSALSSPMVAISLDFHIPFVAFDNLIMWNPNLSLTSFLFPFCYDQICYFHSI